MKISVNLKKFEKLEEDFFSFLIQALIGLGKEYVETTIDFEAVEDGDINQRGLYQQLASIQNDADFLKNITKYIFLNLPQKIEAQLAEISPEKRQEYIDRLCREIINDWVQDENISLHQRRNLLKQYRHINDNEIKDILDQVANFWDSAPFLNIDEYEIDNLFNKIKNYYHPEIAPLFLNKDGLFDNFLQEEWEFFRKQISINNFHYANDQDKNAVQLLYKKLNGLLDEKQLTEQDKLDLAYIENLAKEDEPVWYFMQQDLAITHGENLGVIDSKIDTRLSATTTTSTVKGGANFSIPLPIPGSSKSAVEASYAGAREKKWQTENKQMTTTNYTQTTNSATNIKQKILIPQNVIRDWLWEFKKTRMSSPPGDSFDNTLTIELVKTFLIIDLLKLLENSDDKAQDPVFREIYMEIPTLVLKVVIEPAIEKITYCYKNSNISKNDFESLLETFDAIIKKCQHNIYKKFYCDHPALKFFKTFRNDGFFTKIDLLSESLANYNIQEIAIKKKYLFNILKSLKTSEQDKTSKAEIESILARIQELNFFREVLTKPVVPHPLKILKIPSRLRTYSLTSTDNRPDQDEFDGHKKATDQRLATIQEEIEIAEEAREESFNELEENLTRS
ncbi:hypothetical protein [Spiroplasma eriocheiris]|uniref:Uncharacterized protein n=1 Tax=Spiroplasma eriocheiris TaxID=315358 RepID=A0A0H3XJW0_9MOLU|nr:hypothetical protein [Spiroplasma eriocheiris]AHF57720.1 hypothetical protein SPE_0592 [Spiroplasma eriocheiris CCTCC M 207170]AKM54171.1 hypothetical protein SERIO_v1c06000 [Spiroplasma eriocheiris]